MLPTNFRFIWSCGFRGKFKKSTNQKQELPLAATFVNESGRNEQFHRGLPIDDSYKFLFIWPSGFRGEDLFKSVNQKQELPVVVMFVNGSGRNEESL